MSRTAPLVVIPVLCLVLLSSGVAAAGIARNLSPDEALTLMQNNRSDLFLLDVRTPAEYRDVRIAGAKLIPIDQILARIREIPQDRPVLVYCAVGSRSAQVVGYLARVGFGEVYNLHGGIYAWSQKKLPVLTGFP